jgi:pimeloyl-ACP methyl ester carboxylesterase
MRGASIRLGGLAICGLMLADCQASGKVLVREPGQPHYGRTQDIEQSAIDLAPFAALGATAYDGTFGLTPPMTSDSCDQLSRSEREQKSLSSDIKKCLVNPINILLPLTDGWEIWEDFPSPQLKCVSGDAGLYLRVLEKKKAPHTIAVVFKGTRFSSRADWVSNLRWLHFLLPGSGQDQYTLLRDRVIPEFIDLFREKGLGQSEADKPPVQIVAVGHSLGGGLAQYFAYALPNEEGIPRVSRVYAFDPSPVTGESLVPSELLEHNAKDLEINRIFEHGEILSYVRLLSEKMHLRRPDRVAIRKMRYNLVPTANPIAAHSMLHLACALGIASGSLDIKPGNVKFDCNNIAAVKADIKYREETRKKICNEVDD